MKDTLTIKGFDAITEINYGGEEKGVADIYAIASIIDVPSEVIKRMKPTEYSVLKSSVLSQAVKPANPVYLVKYKGQMFGYYPSEIGTIEDMAAIEIFSKNKKFQALAAALFRPVKPMSRWVHRKDQRWTKHLGIKVKQIGDFKKDALYYQCKDVDMSNADLSFWDDFPWAILMGNLNFLVGSGLQFSLSIHPSSLKSQRIRNEIVNLEKNFQGALSGMIWQSVSHQLMSLNYTDNPELSTWLQEKHSIGSLYKTNEQQIKLLKDSVEEYAWVVTGSTNKGLLNSLFTMYTNLLEEKVLKVNDLLTLCGLMKASSYNNKAQWLIPKTT